jgi:phosphatidylglycerophosphate synthase
MSQFSYRIINLITIYRIVAAPVLIYFVFTGQIDLFKYLLPISFFTDLIDGYLARKFKVISVMGSRLDSIGDDLTVIAALIGLFVFRRDFVMDEIYLLSGLFILFILQIAVALIRYKKISSFHTYLAKIAAILQGAFFILIFLFPEPVYLLFYSAAIVTLLDLIEEIIIVFIEPEWKTDLKGLYWVMKERRKKSDTRT